MIALQWGDLDFDKLEMNAARGIVNQVVGEVKTEASPKPLPMVPVLAAVLRGWKAQAKYSRPVDWVFASDL